LPPSPCASIHPFLAAKWAKSKNAEDEGVAGVDFHASTPTRNKGTFAVNSSRDAIDDDDDDVAADRDVRLARRR